MKKKLVVFVLIFCVCFSIPFVAFADASDYTRIDHLLSDFDENKEASVLVSASGFEDRYYNAYNLTVTQNRFTATQNDAIPQGDVLYIRVSMNDPDGVVIANAGDQLQFVIAGSASLQSDNCTMAISAIVSINGETKYWLLAPSMSPTIFASFHYTNTFQCDSTVRLLGMQFMWSNFDASVTNAPSASCSLTAFNTLNINKTQENINQITGALQDTTDAITGALDDTKDAINESADKVIDSLTNTDGAQGVFENEFKKIQDALKIPIPEEDPINDYYNETLPLLRSINTTLDRYAVEANQFSTIVSSVWNYDGYYASEDFLFLKVLLYIMVVGALVVVIFNVLKGIRL